MEKRLADMNTLTDERVIQAEQYAHKVEEELQGSIERASQAEIRARELEKTMAAWQEQHQVDRIHQQLWVRDQSEAPTPQVVVNSSVEPVDESMESVSDKDKGDSDKRLNDHDMGANEVKRMFDCENILYKLINLIGTI